MFLEKKYFFFKMKTLENTKGAIQIGQVRETGKTKKNKTKQSKNTTQSVLDTTMRKQTQIT